MISQTVEYALRAIVYLGYRHPNPCTGPEMAKEIHVPLPYLSKVMHSLSRSKIVHAKRGRSGGFVLAKTPEEMTMWEVVNSVEPFQRIRECPMGLVTHRPTLCPLHRTLDDAMASAEESFRQTTIAQLIAGAAGVKPLCEEQPTIQLVSLG